MNPMIEWRVVKNQKCLFLSFDGHFSSDHAQHAINNIRKMIGDVDDKFTMVWECTSMGGYDAGAREYWQVFIKNIKPKIAGIHLVSPNIVIRSGAVVVGIFAGIKITSWASLGDFHSSA